MVKIKLHILGIVLILLSGCISALFSLHQIPKINKHFELYNREVTDSLHKILGENLYISNPVTYFYTRYDSLGNKQLDSNRTCYVLLFDSTQILWSAISDKDTLTNHLAKQLSGYMGKLKSGFGGACIIGPNYRLQIAHGLWMLGYNFYYFDMEILLNGTIKLVLKEARKFNKRVHKDEELPVLMNKELLFSPIKIK